MNRIAHAAVGGGDHRHDHARFTGNPQELKYGG
jgi:hypothetical protein